MIHLDANGSTAMLPEVLEAMLPWLRDGHANPSGAYAAARQARNAIEDARGQVAEWIGAEADEIVFTGGGTESVNTALHSLDQLVGAGAAIVSAIEHSAVLRCAEDLSRPVKYAPVHPDGRLDLEKFAALLPGAAMISVMTANNETGVLQPIARNLHHGPRTRSARAFRRRASRRKDRPACAPARRGFPLALRPQIPRTEGRGRAFRTPRNPVFFRI